MSTIEEALKKQRKKQTSVDPVSDLAIENASVIELEARAERSSSNDVLIKNTEQDIEHTSASKSEFHQQSSHSQQITLDTKHLLSKHMLLSDSNQEFNSEQRLLNEEFRQVKRKLLNNAFGVISKTLTHSNLVMISSAQANEGKTFVSVNLALSIALEQDKTVLLIDADVLKPSIPEVLGFDEKRGLIDYLSGQCESIEDIIYSTSLPNLKIIPAGTAHRLANEFLASEKMASLCSELERRYSNRIILFDSPPLLGINETSILAQLMGQALIVVEENRSSLNEIQKANDLLPNDLAKGVVLNKAIHSQKELYGYYGYGYGKRSE